MKSLNVFFLCLACSFYLHGQNFKEGIVAEPGVSFYNLTILKDSLIYTSDLINFSQGVRGIKHYVIHTNGTILDSITHRWFVDSAVVNTFGAFGNSAYTLPSGNVISTHSILDSFSVRQRPLLIKMRTQPTLDSIKTLRLFNTIADSTFQTAHGFGVLPVNDTSLLFFGMAQVPAISGHLEFKQWFAVVDTNLNVLDTRVYARGDTVNELLFNNDNGINAPDGGFIFGTEGRLLPTRQEPSHGGIAKLDSNLNVVWQYHMPTYRTDPRLTNHALQLYTIPQDPNHFYAVQSFSDTCEAWPHIHCLNFDQLFSRRFFKFDWDGQLVSFREDSIKRKAYTIKAATTDEAGNLYYTGFYSGPNIFRGFIQKFNNQLDSIWYVEPTAGFPPENPDLPRNHSRMYVLERIKLINDKLLTGGYMHVPDIPSPQQFAYLTIIDTNGTYQDGTPIGYWSWLSAEAVSQEWTFQVYPQPASSRLTVGISPEANATQLELYDLTGRKLLQQRLEPFVDRHELSLQGISTGSYLLHVLGDNGLIGVRKIVVQQ